MSSIHYKFRSSVDYDTITFDGQAISLSDLRDAIMLQKKIAKSPAYTLEITNAQTKEVYQADDTMVQKNASVIVKRVPVQRLEAVSDQGSGLSKEEEELTEMALAKLSKTADLATAKASEDDKIKAMMKQSTEDFDPSTYQKRAPANYVCYRCGGKGHFVRFCPTQGDPRYNKSQFITRQPSGIPKEYMRLKMKQEKELLDSLRSMQPSNTNFSPVVSSDVVDHTKVPADLQCKICKMLFTDAVVTPCCGDSYCDECIRNHLVEHDLVCLCGETTSPDNLIANRSLRTSVSNYRNQKTAEMKSTPQSSMASTTQPIVNSSTNGPTIKEERSESPKPTITSSATSLPETNGVVNTNVPSPQVPLEPSVTDSPKRIIDRNELQIPVTTVASSVQVQPGLPGIVPNSLSLSAPQHIVNPSYVRGGIYTAQAPHVRPTYHHPVLAQPPIIQQPTVVGSGLSYGLSLPSGATIVKRLVPVAVPGQRIIPQPNQIRIAHVQPQAPVQQAPVPVDLNQRLVPTAVNPNVVQQQPSSGVRKNAESPMPLTEDEFYKWQMKFKTRPPTRRRSRSKSPFRSRSRSPADVRKRRRHRSVSPNDSSKALYDSPAEDSSQERKSRKRKDKLRKRIRDSSQESAKTESKTSKSRNDKKTKSGRRLPEHIKRAVDEFEFDDELEFDKELRRLKSKSNRKKTGDQNDVDGDLSSPEVKQESHTLEPDKQSDSASLSKRVSVESPTLENNTNIKLNNKKESLDTDLVDPGEGAEGEVSQETVEKDSTTIVATAGGTSKAETVVESTEQKVGEAEKPKRKTKIIKKKVIRVIKVARKKRTDGTSTIISKEDVSSPKAEDNDEDSLASKRKANEVKVESPSKKVKIDAKNGNKVTTKRTVLSSKSRNITPEKKKELLKRQTDSKNNEEKAKQLIAEVQAKKEAEKKQLLEDAKKSKPVEKKLKESDEKKRKYERYLLLKKKAKEKAVAGKLRKSQAAATDASENDNTAEDKSPAKKPSKVTLQRKSSDEISDNNKKRPDQHFYKPGDAKLKSISELSKKELQEGIEKKKTSGRKANEETGDVLKSKITSMKNVISSPEKRRMIKTSVSEEERDVKSSQSSDDKSVRRVVQLTDKRSSKGSVASKVEKISSRSSRTSDRDSKNRGESSEVKDNRHSRHYESDDRRSSTKDLREREKEYERERRERKRLQLLEKEKEESMEREKLALREKERLERKLERERQLRKEMEKEREIEERSRRKYRDDEKLSKRKLRGDATESDDEERSGSKRAKKTSKSQTIQVLDSDEEEEKEETAEEEEEESSEPESEKKRKKKSKKRKEKRKKKKKEENSEDDSEDSSDDDEPKKKKKRKHKKKHKKRKSRKHKKKSKKKKKKHEKSGSESSEEEVEEEDITEEAANTEEGDDESGSDSKSEADSGASKDNKDESSSEKSESDTEEAPKVENEDPSTTEEKNEEKTKAENSSHEEESKKESKTESAPNVPEKSTKVTSTGSSNERKKRSTLGDADDLELDYDDVDIEDEDALLYNDLDFVDDEQTNPESVDELTSVNNKKESDSGEYEEGEILDDELFVTTANSKPTSASEEITTDVNDDDVDDDTELDDVIDDAMNNFALASSSAVDSENETAVTMDTDQKNENVNSDDTTR